jgi:hypothetical protein
LAAVPSLAVRQYVTAMVTQAPYALLICQFDPKSLVRNTFPTSGLLVRFSTADEVVESLFSQ